MRPADKTHFSQAAREFGLWILVRRTNPASLQFIGRAGYVPKPLDCKAKTAERNVGPCLCAGLVVDPTIQPHAFSSPKLAKALAEWREHGKRMLSSGRYTVETKDQRLYGLVKLNGMFLYGDYDLYDIIDPEQAVRNLAAVESLLGQPHLRGPNLYRVQQYLNSRIGVPMVQHGGEMQFTDHSEQSLDAFGPAGENVTILNQLSVRTWYAERFHNRQPLK